MANDLSVPLNDIELIGGRWEVHREIGRGATGTVHVGWDREMERDVAIKIIEARHSANQQVCDRFADEIRTTAQLTHPGVIAVHAAGSTISGQLCYVMALAKGQTLEALIDGWRNDPAHWQRSGLAERLQLFLKILDIMAYAHTLGVVHRDLKPANIMVGHFGEVWILDWGLARRLKALTPDAQQQHFEEVFESPTPTPRTEAVTVIISSDQPHTEAQGTTRRTAAEQEAAQAAQAGTKASQQSPVPSPASSRSSRTRSQSSNHSQRLARSTHDGQIMGSPAYMSPEQALGRADRADTRTDIYSLGCVLYELLALHTPVEPADGESLEHMLDRVRSGLRTPLATWWPDAPRGLRDMLDRALALDPQRRYVDCTMFASDVRAFVSQLAASWAEIERQRLEHERAGAWLPVGRWDYQASDDPGPLISDPISQGGEAVGQVHHPELGGMLLGGCGLQLYPLHMHAGDDIRIDIELRLLQGSEYWVMLRGVWPGPHYQVRIGAYHGHWMMIMQAGEVHEQREILNQRPLRNQQSDQRHRLRIEAVGGTLSVQLNNEALLTAHDVSPLLSPEEGIQLGIATWESQVLVTSLAVERRRSPRLVPAWSIGANLLRLNQPLEAQAELRRYLADHGDSDEMEARYLLAQALRMGGDTEGAMAELEGMLSEHPDDDLGQDALFDLARLRLKHGGLRKAVATILGSQEQGDLARSRFGIWLLDYLFEQVRAARISDDVLSDLATIRFFLRGSPDEQDLLRTLATPISGVLLQHAERAIDSNDHELMRSVRELRQRVLDLGYELSLVEPRLQEDYEMLARLTTSPSDVARLRALIGDDLDADAGRRCGYVRDVLWLVAMGSAEQIEAVLTGENITPIQRLLRIGLRLRNGNQEGAQADIDVCFRMTDALETNRTSTVMLFAARMGCWILGYLPWSLVEDGIIGVMSPLLRGMMLAIAAWIAENRGETDLAIRLWTSLIELRRGFLPIANQGLARLGIDSPDGDERADS